MTADEIKRAEAAEEERDFLRAKWNLLERVIPSEDLAAYGLTPEIAWDERLRKLADDARNWRMVKQIPLGCGLKHHTDGDGGVEWICGIITSITVFEMGDNPADVLRDWLG